MSSDFRNRDAPSPIQDRKARLAKEGAASERRQPPPRTDNTPLKALARAFRWKRLLECGQFGTISELADREGIASSYLTLRLRLTLLAPDIVEVILNGKQGPDVVLRRMLEPLSADWLKHQSSRRRSKHSAQSSHSRPSSRAGDQNLSHQAGSSAVDDSLRG